MGVLIGQQVGGDYILEVEEEKVDGKKRSYEYL